MAENISQEKEIAQSPRERQRHGDLQRRSIHLLEKPESCVSDIEALEESILMPAPDSVEDSYRSEDESGVSDDEYVSEFNNKNINHIACIRTRVIVSLLKT